MSTRDLPEPLKTEAAQRLAAARIALGIHQKDAAGVVSVTPHAWSQYEKGSRTPHVVLLIKFCDKFDISLDWIFRGNIGSLKGHLIPKVADAHQKILDGRPHNRRATPHKAA